VRALRETSLLGGVGFGRDASALPAPRVLKVLLEREVGSAYSALEEREFEGRCMRLSLEELLEIISRRRLERKLLK